MSKKMEDIAAKAAVNTPQVMQTQRGYGRTQLYQRSKETGKEVGGR